MSGHSKWSTIKRQKGANDAKRGQLFTKLAATIAIATREGGGGDMQSNIRLRLAVEKARQYNMPKYNIDRAIERGLGKGNDKAIESVLYEGFGPSQVGILVSAATDNRNRTTAEVKTAFDKHDGLMGQPGSVSWQFEPVGLILVENVSDVESVSFAAIDAGAADIKEDGESMEIYTQTTDLHAVKQSLETAGFQLTEAILTMHAKQIVKIDREEASKLTTLLERLEDLEDVLDVYTNADLPYDE